METEVAPPLCNGRYKLIGILGAGGMAKVYKAYDKRLEVHRAIKILSPAYASHPEIRKRFLTEARTTARLNHPNIVTAHDIGADNDRLFIVMEFVEGGSLWDRMRETGPLSARVSLEVMSALLPALQSAHDHGVIHRDIKPGNILVAKDGTYKLADFGIARVAETEAAMTRTGSLLGTPAYMAPEQWNGSREIDARADVFAMGATLYSLLTQRTPQDIHIPEAQVEQLKGLPDRLSAIIMRATRYRPADRYSSALEMLEGVRAALEPASAMPQAGGGEFLHASGPASLPTGSVRNLDAPDDVVEPRYLRLEGDRRLEPERRGPASRPSSESPRIGHMGASMEVPMTPMSGSQSLREVFVGDLSEGMGADSDDPMRQSTSSMVTAPMTPTSIVSSPQLTPPRTPMPLPEQRPPRELPVRQIRIGLAILVGIALFAGGGYAISHVIPWLTRTVEPTPAPVPTPRPVDPPRVLASTATLTPPAGADRGTLVAECRPNCLVSVDEQPVGTGKVTIELSPGSHGLSLGETGARLRTRLDVPKDGQVSFCYDTVGKRRCTP